MKKKLAALLSIILVAGCALAQDPAQDATASTAQPVPVQRFDNVRPLSGFQAMELGDAASEQRVLEPSFFVSEAYGTNPGLLPQGPNSDSLGSTGSVGGALKFVRGDSAKAFALSYAGNAQINSYDTSNNMFNNGLTVSQSLTHGRWTLLGGDTVSYLKGGGAYSGVLYPTGTPDTASGFRPGTTPNDSVIVQQNSQLNNTAVGQASYGLSRATALTGSFSYGTQHFIEGGLIDSTQINGAAGLDHRYGHNTVGVTYTFSRFEFNGTTPGFDTNTAQLMYGRRMAGRFAVELAAGPTFVRSQNGSTTNTEVKGSGRALLRYDGKKGSFFGGYLRSVTGGSGISAGALTDSVTGGASLPLSRLLSLELGAAYNRNSGMATMSNVNTVVSRAVITRSMTRMVSLSIGYQGQRQISALTNANIVSDAVVVSLRWNLHSVRFK